MMSQLLKTDIKLINGLARLHFGPGIGSGAQIRGDVVGCPNCGSRVRALSVDSRRQYVGRRYLPAYPRLFSTKPSSSPLPPPVKKSSKKKSKKTTKSTTEIIRESEDLLVSETEALLVTLPPKDLASYLVKFQSESKNSSKKAATSRFLRGQMSYSTSGFIPFPMFNYSGAMESPMGAQLAENDVGGGVFLSEIEMEDTLNAEEGFEDTIVIPNKGCSRNSIPGEKDLIDSEIDLEAELSAKLSLSEEAKDKSILIENSNLTSNESIQTLEDKEKSIAKKKSNKARLKTDERELLAKVKRDEMEKLAREVSLNKSLLAYLDMCIFTGQINRGLQTLNFYRNRSKTGTTYPAVTDINAFNCLLHGFAKKGNLMKVKEIFKSILEDGLRPSVQTYAAVLECLGRSASNGQNRQNINWYIDQLNKEGYNIHDLFNKTVFAGDQREIILQAIKRRIPDFVPIIQKPSTEYSCGLLQNLNKPSFEAPVISPAENLMPLGYLQSMTQRQLQMELKGTITIKSVERKDDLENLPYYRELLQNAENTWSVAIKEALERNFATLLNQGMKYRSHKTIGLYPFLKVLKPEHYVEIIGQEIRKLAEGSETYSPGVTQLYRELGCRVLARYQVLYKKEKGIFEKVQHLYNEYITWYLDPSLNGSTSSRNPRQKWQELLYSPEICGPDVDINEKTWPNSVLVSVGRFLYGIVMRDIKIDAQIMKQGVKTEHLVPAFYSIFRLQGVHLKEEIKPHPALVKLFQAASKEELTFDATVVPMLSPPLPWASIRTGGYLLTPARIIRLPFQAHQQKVRLESCPPEDLYPSLDSLNQLGAVPWKINHRLLDTVISVFNDKGDDDLGIPPPPSECPLPPTLDVNMTRQEKLQIHKSRLVVKRKKAEMYSLWCDALYRLSLANHFRNDIFWFPHNMDFRGRVYPCPPHLNHLGADMARSILVFAQGKPLGPKGLDWLKIHLVNLTGLKKRNSVEERLSYANEILGDILDSADNPLTGRKWWAESEEPWQTLACCMEIANAIRSGDPKSYVTHFPVHQDGSCNGLQHYAALGRDQAGAESVNLAPSPLPQDVYSSVASLVEKLRENDAQKGVKIAQVLENFITRKVIKQTVMTTVYGVTRYGARLQIAKQLKDLPNFPKEHIWSASIYLTGRTFDSLQEMFTSTKEIQDWFTECARLISQVCGQNVEWITPLGLPVVQPYFRASKKSYEGFDPLKLPETHIFDTFERPNVMKQKNAFPPNFVHSLDSSHMMLTSLNAEQAGITFVSVHDCYWTHPCSVEIMNKICREQFVALHTEPILENLSNFLVEKYSYKESEFFKDGSVVDAHKGRLNQLLTEVPVKGSFNLQSVLKSTYFFS